MVYYAAGWDLATPLVVIVLPLLSAQGQETPKTTIRNEWTRIQTGRRYISYISPSTTHARSANSNPTKTRRTGIHPSCSSLIMHAKYVFGNQPNWRRAHGFMLTTRPLCVWGLQIYVPSSTFTGSQLSSRNEILSCDGRYLIAFDPSIRWPPQGTKEEVPDPLIIKSLTILHTFSSACRCPWKIRMRTL